MTTTDSGQDSGRTAIVTGAGRGIGEAIAVALANDGYAIAVSDIDAGAAATVAERIRNERAVAQPFEVDVSSAASVSRLFARVSAELGPPDVLVNNAGVISVAPIVDLTEDEWQRILAVNLTSVFLCTRKAIPSMVQRGWGRIINIASDGGKTAEPFLAHYCASKFGVIGLTQSTALELAADGVTANAICPAICETPMMQEVADGWAERGESGRDSASYLDDFIAEIPAGRAARPTDIAATVSFIASEAAEFISGQAINVSGAHEVH